MKYLVVAAIVFVIVTFAIRRRHVDEARTTRSGTPRRPSMHSTEDGAVNVRSADNVRLISDDQLDALEHDAKRTD